MDINYTGGIIASFIAVLLTDMVKIERWTDNAKLGLALAVSVAVAEGLSAIDGRLGFNVGMGANIAIVITHSMAIFKGLNVIGVSDGLRKYVLAQMTFWRDVFLGPPPSIPGR